MSIKYYIILYAILLPVIFLVGFASAGGISSTIGLWRLKRERKKQPIRAMNSPPTIIYTFVGRSSKFKGMSSTIEPTAYTIVNRDFKPSKEKTTND